MKADNRLLQLSRQTTTWLAHAVIWIWHDQSLWTVYGRMQPGSRILLCLKERSGNKSYLRRKAAKLAPGQCRRQVQSPVSAIRWLLITDDLLEDGIIQGAWFVLSMPFGSWWLEDSELSGGWLFFHLIRSFSMTLADSYYALDNWTGTLAAASS